MPRFGKSLGRIIAPFRNTPSAIAIKTVYFSVPIFPAINVVFDSYMLSKTAARKDSALKERQMIKYQRQLAEHTGELIVSTALMGTALILISNGLATGDLPDDDTEKKDRAFMYATQPANTINITGLKRLLNGEDPTYRP